MNTSCKLKSLLTLETTSLLTLRSVSSQGEDELPRASPDVLVPQVLRHASPEALNHAIRLLAQNQDGPPPIDNQELEELGVRFLASTSHVRDWSNNLSVADQNRQTIAHRCVLFGYTRLLTKVIDWDVDLDVQDVSGLTALHCAYLCEDWDCVRILKNAGAGENIKDNLGRIPREMCQHVDDEGTIYSEREVASTPARFSSMGEQVWANIPNLCAPSENLTLPGTQTVFQPPWRSLGDINAVGGIYASPMPIPAPWSEHSSSADDESWTQAFNNLQISETPVPFARPIANSSSGRRDIAPRYGQGHLLYSPPPSETQWSAPSGAPATVHDPPTTSSFEDLLLAFPMPQPFAPPFPVPEPAVPFPIPEPAVPFPIPEPAVPVPLPIHELAELAVSSFSLPVLDPATPSFPVPEPTGFPEEMNHYADMQPPLQRDSPGMVPSLISRYHIPMQTSSFHGPHVALSNLPAFSSQQWSPESSRRPYQPPPNASSTRYAPPPGPPPSPPPPPLLLRNVSLGVVPSPPPHLSQSQRVYEWRRQLQENMMRAWPSVAQEEKAQSVKLRMEEKTVTLEKGALADLKASTKDIKVVVGHF